MDIFKKHFRRPTKSPATNLKVLLLSSGLDFDFGSIKKNFPDIHKDYKVNQIRVSDRHHISPESGNRDYLPDELLLTDNYTQSLAKVYYKKNSFFVLKVIDKKFKIFSKKENIEIPVKAEPTKILNYANLDYKGYKLSEFVAVLGQDRISILPFEGCEHWTIGEQCKFCGANPKRLKFREYKSNVYDIIPRYKGDCVSWWKQNEEFTLSAIDTASEKLTKLDKLKPHIHFFVLSGGLFEVDYLWEICLKISKTVNKHIKIKNTDSYINLIPPNNFNYISQAKKVGFKQICYNLEVFGEKKFKKTCPGKQTAYGYNNFLEAFEKTVKIFGSGNVRSNFVLGIQPIPDLIKGVKYLAQRGIVSDYTVFFQRPGSVWHYKKPPKPDEILHFTRELVKTYRKYNFKPFCCSQSSRSSIANEIYNIE